MNGFKVFNCLTLVSMAVVAVSGTANAIEPKPRNVGNMQVTTSITTSLGYGDNVFRGASNETSSSFLSAQPVVEAVNETASQKLSFGYEGDGVAFFDSSDDNYLSNALTADYLRSINSISQFSVGAGFEDGSTIRGTDITEGTNGTVDGATDFTRKDFSIGYAIGSPKTGPSIELNYNFTDLEFDNFEFINQGRDYQLDKFTARLGYQYSVATKFFIDLSNSDFDYDQAVPFLGGQLDNTEQAVMVGVQWRLSRLTSGEISIGTTDKEFDNFEDPGSLTTWNVSLDWTPTPRDTVTVEGFSRPFEQAGTGTFQDIDQATIAWERDLSKVLSLKTGLTLGSVNFENVARDDDFDKLSLGLLYKPTRYSEWSLNYEREEKDSNLSQFDFDTNTVFLSYAISL
ncbi:MAG: outer membrane beta-barrel protein [Acidiferrobacterales bacterium]|nr:outer membrane beta-barrel protein [Acidiferrobacterales bacterium]